MNAKVEKVKDILRDRESLSTALVVMALMGILFKNILFWAYLYGDNYYETNFVTGLSEGLSHCYISLSCIALFCSLVLLMEKKKSRLIYLVALDGFLSFLSLIYICYIRFFNDLPSVRAFSIIRFDSDDMPSEMGNLMMPFVFSDVLFIIDFIAIFGVWFWKSRLGNFSFGEPSFVRNSIEKAGFCENAKANGVDARRRAEGARKGAFAAVSALTAICLFSVPLDCSARGAASMAYKEVYDAPYARDKGAALSPIGYLADDISRNIFASKNITDEEKTLVESYFEWNKNNYAPSEYTGKFIGKNFLFLQLESFEDFVIGNSIDGQEITPNLNKLLKKSYYFHNVKDRAMNGTSSDCDTMGMLSMVPSKTVPTFAFYPHNTYVSMPQLFQNQGYNTVYYMGAGGSIWNYNDMMKHGVKFKGADFDFDSRNKVNTYISDESLLEQALAKMDKKRLLSDDKPFYAHITLCNSHTPFIMPKKLCGLKLSKSLAANPMGDYLQAVNYVDGVLGRFLAEAEERGYLDNTVVLFTGDHRGVHKYYPHEINKLSDKDYKEWMGKNNDASLPIIIYDPEMPDGEARTFEAYGSHIDTMPTVMDLFGVSHDLFADTAMGRSLFSPAFNAAVDGFGTFFNNPSETDKEFLLASFKVAEIIYRTDYFAKR